MFATLHIISKENKVVAAKTACPYPPPSFLQTQQGVTHQGGANLPPATGHTHFQAQLLKLEWLPRWFSSRSASHRQVFFPLHHLSEDSRAT